MAVLKRRTRVVSFRLSEEEYMELRNSCIAQGARSVSDYARAAACRLAGARNGSQESTVEVTIRKLFGSYQELDREVKRLARLIEEPSQRVAPVSDQPSMVAQGVDH